jgi:hypothetical protein
MTNPYTWNRVNLEIVYGRGKIINELLSGMPRIPPISYALTAGRRMGKSTVLRSVEKELAESQSQWITQDVLVVPVYIDGLTLQRPIEPGALWGRLFRELQSKINPSVVERYPALSFEEFIEKTKHLLNASPRAVRIVVLFDEIEPILYQSWSDGYFANWRALLSNTPPISSYIAAVFSGAQELVRLRQDVGSPLMDVLELRSLSNLGLDESKRLMIEPTQTDWNTEFYEYLYSESGGHPMLLQYLMQAVCNRRSEVPALEAAIQGRASFLAERSWQFSDWWYKDCSQMAQSVYRRLPEDFSWISLKDLAHEFGARQANDALDLLQHVGIATANDDGLAFRRAGKMFASWQKEKGQPTPAPSHDPEIYFRLTSIEQDFADKYASAWRILGADLPNYSGAVSEMRDTLTLVLHHLAPDDAVINSEGFTLELDQTRPTRRQRARYVGLNRLGSKEIAKTLAGDVEALEFNILLLEKSVARAYGMASSLTHTTSTRELAYQSLKQGDSILAQLLAPASS